MELEAVLTNKTEKLNIKLAETNLKREQVKQASEEQNVKVTALEVMNKQIRSEKEETEREKDEALRLAEKLGLISPRSTRKSSRTRPCATA